MTKEGGGLMCTCASFVVRINSAPVKSMKRLFLLAPILALLVVSRAAAAPLAGEYIILVGGPSGGLLPPGLRLETGR